MDKPEVTVKDKTVYLIGRIKTCTGSVDGHFASWLEMSVPDARKMAEDILSATREDE